MQTLLVVEDDPVMHEALAELLRLEGYEVVSVRTIADATRILDACILDGALVDWWINGVRCDDLVADLAARGITTVLLSAHTDARAFAEELGVPCVHKPFVVDQLVGIVSGAISRRSLRKMAISRLGS